MAANVFKQTPVHADYVDKFFEGHDHPRLSWLYYIGKERYAAAGTILSGMSVSGDRGSQNASENRIGCVNVGLQSNPMR